MKLAINVNTTLEKPTKLDWLVRERPTRLLSILTSVLNEANTDEESDDDDDPEEQPDRYPNEHGLSVLGGLFLHSLVLRLVGRDPGILGRDLNWVIFPSKIQALAR